MEKARLRSPFFVVNPKSYLYGEDVRRLARKADGLCERYDFECLFTAQLIDLPWVVENCPHLIPCAQSMESLRPGRGWRQGHLPEPRRESPGRSRTCGDHRPCRRGRHPHPQARPQGSRHRDGGVALPQVVYTL
ncbi:hypothetical protein IV77_GL001397 [Olsenella uli DSM 7084]|nr:hypothetical protein IV77_GL001397 [Olsenella uli DSM 7084]